MAEGEYDPETGDNLLLDCLRAWRIWAWLFADACLGASSSWSTAIAVSPTKMAFVGGQLEVKPFVRCHAFGMPHLSAETLGGGRPIRFHQVLSIFFSYHTYGPDRRIRRF